MYVEGSLRTRKWQDQSGQDKYTTEVVASEMQMLDSRGAGGGMGGGMGGGNMGGGANGGGNDWNAPPAQSSSGNAMPQGGGSFDPIDDDIPF